MNEKTYKITITKNQLYKLQISIKDELDFWTTNRNQEDEFLKEIINDWIRELEDLLKQIEEVPF